MQLLICFFFFILSIKSFLFSQSYYDFPWINEMKRRFESTFHQKCDKYSSLISQYSSQLQQLQQQQQQQQRQTPHKQVQGVSPSLDHRFLIFVFQDEKKTGGFGDRLAGLVTAIALAIKHQRILLIKDQSKALAQYFHPYYYLPPSSSSTNSSKTSFFPNYSVSFDLTGQIQEEWLEDPTITLELFCLNIKNSNCAMENGEIEQYASKKILLYRSNRAYLCRYSEIPSFQSSLQIHRGSNLFEVAGCLLRLVLWPKEELWKLVDEEYSRQLKERLPVKAEGLEFHQVAIHYRCGDFNYVNDSRQTHCYHQHSTPAQLGQCALQYYSQSQVNPRFVRNTQSPSLGRRFQVLFIASDHPPSTQLIVQQLNDPSKAKQPLPYHLYLSSSGCHVGKTRTKDCLSMTIVYWFMLALSETYFTQTTEKYMNAFSAYSRYAGIYSLAKDPFRLGGRCQSAENKQAGRLNELNWVCSVAD